MDFYFFNQCLYKYLRYNSVIFLEKKKLRHVGRNVE